MKAPDMTTTRTFAALAILMASQFALAGPADPSWEADVRKFDSEYWQAFNQCDVARLAKLNTSNLEFYHDVGGPMFGRDKFVAAIKNNICGDPKRRVRREAIADSVRVFPLRDEGTLYGAIVSGEHQFYNSTKGANEYLTGTARFTHVVLLDKGNWKVSRVLSFDHAPAKFVSPLVAVELAGADLQRLAGSYFSKEKELFKVAPVDTHLVLTVGGYALTLFPTGPHAFFTKDRDMTVTFLAAEGGKGRQLVMREHGEIVEQATARD
jgi:hypothetical protein